MDEDDTEQIMKHWFGSCLWGNRGEGKSMHTRSDAGANCGCCGLEATSGPLLIGLLGAKVVSFVLSRHSRFHNGLSYI